jgi:hypothetical protein
LLLTVLEFQVKKKNGNAIPVTGRGDS